MGYKACTLPEYPLASDMWEELRNETRPIVVYGMGNGADKLFARLERYGIVPTDIFASDGFVRGHSFHGMRVKSFSEIRREYSDFVILLSFASNRTEVIEMLSDINDKYDMYAPDMPVADESEYFDKDFYNSHYSEICEAYDRLSDEESKNAFSLIIRYKLSGRISYLLDCYSTKDELYSLLPCDKIKTFLDAGAYNGDTLSEAVERFPGLSSAIAVEPDSKNYKRLLKYALTLSDIKVDCIMSALGDCVGDGIFCSSGNRNSTLSATSSYEHKDMTVDVVTVDSLNAAPDYIKYDVEGSELEALIGSDNTIEKYHPALLVSLYHRSRDIFSLINHIGRKYPFYKMKLRRLLCLPAWEIDLILSE